MVVVVEFTAEVELKIVDTVVELRALLWFVLSTIVVIGLEVVVEILEKVEISFLVEKKIDTPNVIQPVVIPRSSFKIFSLPFKGTVFISYNELYKFCPVTIVS